MIQTLADALADRGYDTLTPVQQAVTAPDLLGADLLVSAQTGSGKTVGFGLAIAATLLDGAEVLGQAGAPLALIIAPTRELAFQVKRELAWLYGKAGATVVSCVGGMDMRDERRALDRGAHIVVATPGRLKDHILRGNLTMTSLRAVVLDEADEMLDLGFREDLEFILGEAPESRRTLMFSATVPPAIATLAQHYQRDAVRVSTTTGAKQHADIDYRALTVAPQDGENAIINVLRYHDAENALVFANTRAMVARLTARFSNRGFAVVSLSGELSQSERTHALQAMRDGRAKVCVATDVAARGIDLPNLDLVVHAELPSNGETLLHRSGRTGRAGRKGISALIVTPRDRKKADRLLKTARITATWESPPSADEILRRDEERLLADPAWTEEITPEQAAFAAKLLDLYAPDQIAAAYLRLYQTQHSAPEDLSAPGTAPAPRSTVQFGTSVWFSISTGRDNRAEARWLLPLLCKAGNIGKDDIGAIRIQQHETFFELTEASVAGFLAALGPGMQPEDGLKITRLDKAPDLTRGPRGTAPARSPRPAPRAEGDATQPKPRAKPKPQAAAPQPEARPDAPAAPVAPAPAPDQPQTAAAAQPAPKAPFRKKSEAPRKPDSDRPRKPNGDAAHAPRADSPRKSKDSTAGTPHGDGPRKPGPAGGYKGKPGGKPATAGGYKGKPGTKPAAAGGYKGKPGGKPAPAGGFKGKPGTKPAAPRADASDTSKRFVPPGGTARKPRTAGGKPRGKGGDAFPRRGKS
jgi:ATP-dependent RNA helicase DeaD